MRVTFERAPPVPIHPALRLHCAAGWSDRCLSGGEYPRTESGRPSHLMSITSSVSPAVDKDTALAHARAAIENRTKYIESLFDAAQAAADAREKVAEATRAAERANTEHARPVVRLDVFDGFLLTGAGAGSGRAVSSAAVHPASIASL